LASADVARSEPQHKPVEADPALAGAPVGGRARRTFASCVFCIDESYAHSAPAGVGASEVCELLTQHGGRYFDHVPARPPPGVRLFVLCPVLGWPGPSKALQALPTWTAVTYMWVQACIRDQCTHDPELKILYSPLPLRFPLADATTKVISTTGFQQREKDELALMVAAMGAEFADRLSRKQCTHLLCAANAGGEKFVKAKEWGIECAGREWIEACVQHGAWVDVSAYRVAGAPCTGSGTSQQQASWTQGQGTQGTQVAQVTQVASSRSEQSSVRSSFPCERPGALPPKPVVHHAPHSKENAKNGSSLHAATRADTAEAPSGAGHPGGHCQRLFARAKPSPQMGSRKRDREGGSAGVRENADDSFGVEGVPATKSMLVPDDLKELANSFGEEIRKRRRMHGSVESQASSGSGSQAERDTRHEHAGGAPSRGSQQPLGSASLGRPCHGLTHGRAGPAQEVERSNDRPIAGVASMHASTAESQVDDSDSVFAEAMRSLGTLPANAHISGSAFGHSIFGRRPDGGAEQHVSLNAIRKAWPTLPRRRPDACQDGSSAGSAHPSPKVNPSPPTTVLPRPTSSSAYGKMSGDGEESTQSDFAVVYCAAGDQIDHAALVDQTHLAAADGSVTSTQIDREVEAMCIPVSSLDPVCEEAEDELSLRNGGAAAPQRPATREQEHLRLSVGMNSLGSTPDFASQKVVIMLTNWPTAAANGSGTKSRGAGQGSKSVDAACVHESQDLPDEALERLRELGAHVEHSAYIDVRCTHLVTSCPENSEKYLGAIAAGVWILRPSFVHASVLAGRLVAEEDHEWNREAIIDAPASNNSVDEVRRGAHKLGLREPRSDRTLPRTIPTMLSVRF
jgi:hypothetical protein